MFNEIVRANSPKQSATVRSWHLVSSAGWHVDTLALGSLQPRHGITGGPLLQHRYAGTGRLEGGRRGTPLHVMIGSPGRAWLVALS